MVQSKLFCKEGPPNSGFCHPFRPSLLSPVLPNQVHVSRYCYLSILKASFFFIFLYLYNKKKLISCSLCARLFSYITSSNSYRHPVRDCFISILEMWKWRPSRGKYQFFILVCSLVSKYINFLSFVSALNIFPSLGLLFNYFYKQKFYIVKSVKLFFSDFFSILNLKSPLFGSLIHI